MRSCIKNVLMILFLLLLVIMTGASLTACESGGITMYAGDVTATPSAGGFSLDAPTTCALFVSIEDGEVSGRLDAPKTDSTASLTIN